MDEVRIAHLHGLQHLCAERPAPARSALLHGLALRPNFVVRHLRAHRPGTAVRLAVEASRHEAMAVGVDEVAWNVFAQCCRRWAWQVEIHRAAAPEGNLGPTHHAAHLQAITGQKAFRGQHAEGIEIVMAFSLATLPLGTLQPLHQVVAASEQRLILRFQRAKALALLIEAANLTHRPLQATAQAGHDFLKAIDERGNVRLQSLRRRHVRILRWPALCENGFSRGGEISRVVIGQCTQTREVEGLVPQFAKLEQIRFHSPWQALRQRCANGFTFGFGTVGISSIPMQPGDHRGMDMLGHHQLVAQIEGWRIDAAAQQFRRLGKVGAVVRNRAAIGDVHCHAMAATGAASALPIVGRQRRHVAHQHRVQLTDVDAELQGGCAD